jgi:hypothetical protein
MKKAASICAFVLGLGFMSLPARGQTYWVLSYQGTTTAGGSNKLTTVTVTENTFIEKCAAKAGISTDNLALVLHFNASGLGDALEVINVNDPNLFRCEIFRLAFPLSYTNSAGTVLKRFAYVYDETSDHSRGSVVLKRKEGQGAMLEGTLIYWLGIWNESVSDPNAIVGSGSFKGIRALDFP